MKKNHVEGLTIKRGPAEGLAQVVTVKPAPVGGELIPANLLASLPRHLLLLLILLLPLGFLLYRKSGSTLKTLTRLFLR
jgi:hypothetical protein